MFFHELVLSIAFFLYIYTIMRIQNKNIIASILFVLISFVCIGQNGAPGPPPPEAMGAPPPPGFPIDGASTIAIIAGLFYGIKKTLKHYKD
jgi:hypothetical protein